jgi:squalene cyclase
MDRARRRFFVVAATSGWALRGAWRLDANPPADPDEQAREMITAAAAAAIERGLANLAAQAHADGSFGSRAFRGNTAVSALAAMALMASGSTPGRGPYGAAIDRCVDYLLVHTQDSGFIAVPGATSRGPMYDHGFATLFLAEAYGMSMHPELREKLAAAVRLITRAQNSEGGWRYDPQPHDADISVTVCQVMALRAARNAGIHVPRVSIDRSVDYMKRCQNEDGGFRYMAEGGQSGFARSAAALVGLYSAGVYEGPDIEKGLDYLMQHIPRGSALSRQEHFFYGHYYAVQAMWQAGGKYWAAWYPAIRDALVARQRDDGAWTDPTVCDEYGTAMACLILQVPNCYLPIFQR